MEYIDYDDDSDDSEYSYGDDNNLSGGKRDSGYLQSGNNTVSNPYNFKEMMSIASAGKRPSVETVVKRGRGRPKKELKEKEVLEKKLGCEGGRRKPLIKRKTMEKIASNPITKQIIHEAVRAGIAYATSGASEMPSNEMPVSGAGKHTFRKFKNTMKTFQKNPLVRETEREIWKQGSKAAIHYINGQNQERPSGGRSARGVIVGKIMREKGLSLCQASKYVKEHNLY